MMDERVPIFRFAPSPNGALHLGHAYSALLNFRMAREVGGTFLVRVEDIDTTRCTPELEEQMLEDLVWLGIEWDGEPRRQSDHFGLYGEALETLKEAGLVYPAFMTRGEIKRSVEQRVEWPRDPDGSPHYPGTERDWPKAKLDAEMAERDRWIWRLNMQAALEHAGGDIVWQETGHGPLGANEPNVDARNSTSGGLVSEVLTDPAAWGDVVLARVDVPTSYHLSVVVDDAEQGVSHVVRGRDLFYATAVHRLLQVILGLPAPIYHHHDLVLGEDGRKLSKSVGDTSLRALREAGVTPFDIQRMIGLDHA